MLTEKSNWVPVTELILGFLAVCTLIPGYILFIVKGSSLDAIIRSIGIIVLTFFSAIFGLSCSIVGIKTSPEIAIAGIILSAGSLIYTWLLGHFLRSSLIAFNRHVGHLIQVP